MKIGRLSLGKALLAIIVLVLLAGFAFIAFGMDARARNNMIIAYIANEQIGDPIIFNPDYDRYGPSYPWMIETNSLWLSDQSRLIVPFLVREGVVVFDEYGAYPNRVVFWPNMGDRSFRVLGSAYPFMYEVYINERLVLQEDPPVAEVLSTLVHELIHLQGGYFFMPWNPAMSEAYTTTAQIEVLAGMCRTGRLDACQAFWTDIRSLALSASRAAYMRAGQRPVYEWLMNIFFRDVETQIQVEKWHRDYPLDPKIVERYALIPYEGLIIPHLLVGHEMIVYSPWEAYLDPDPAEQLDIDMPLDDTARMLGPTIKSLMRRAYFWIGTIKSKGETSMFEYELTLELFGLLFGALVSILFSWVPWVRTWFAGLKEDNKQLTMLGISALLLAFMALSSCFGFWIFHTCDKVGFMKLVMTWAAFLLGNQAAHKVVPKPTDVKIVKEAGPLG